MADDIDDLLDEVESKFVVKSRTNERKPTGDKRTTSRKNADIAEMDDLINDICDPPEPLGKSNIVRNAPSKSSQSRPRSSKCFPVIIGGSAFPKGLGSTVNKRCCDQMRCTSCDFKVVSFDDFEWDPSTDYLFLRNNVPDFDRLKLKLTRKTGSRSYCCQCSNVSVSQLTDVKDLQVKWVCGTH